MFWTFFIATSPDEDFGALQMEASRTTKNLTLKNNDSFDYEELVVNIGYLDTLINSSSGDSIAVRFLTKQIDLGSMESKTLSFNDFETLPNMVIPDSIMNPISVDVNCSCPDFDACFFQAELN